MVEYKKEIKVSSSIGDQLQKRQATNPATLAVEKFSQKLDKFVNVLCSDFEKLNDEQGTDAIREKIYIMKELRECLKFRQTSVAYLFDKILSMTSEEKQLFFEALNEKKMIETLTKSGKQLQQ